jgi:hypothetical protein
MLYKKENIMKIGIDKHSSIDTYNFEKMPKFTPLKALDHLALSQSIIYGMEIYLAKIIEVVFRNPDCKDDEKFWVECQVNKLITHYLQWFKPLLKEFGAQIKINHFSDIQTIVEIKLNIEFNTDGNKYCYNYYFTINKKGLNVQRDNTARDNRNRELVEA